MKNSIISLGIFSLFFGSLFARATESLDTALVRAVDRNNSAEVARLLKNGVSPNINASPKEPLLCVAVRNGEILKLLIEAGGNPATLCRGDETLLSAASYQASAHENANTLASLRYLLEMKNVDVNSVVDSKTVKGKSALFSAVSNTDGPESMKAVEMLLTKGADPNLASCLMKNGQVVSCTYPLVIAARKQNLRLVELLLKFKAQPNDSHGPNKGHSSALKVAVENHAAEIEKLLRAAGAKE